MCVLIRWMALAGLAALASAETNTAARAREAVDRLLGGKYQELYQSFDERMQKALPVEKLEKQVAPPVRSMGKVLSIGAAKLTVVGDHTVATIPVKFESRPVDMQVTVASDGRIAGLFMRPGTPAEEWKRPAYSVPERFTERDITVGAGEWKLPGTLTMPKSAKPVACVVLVHGSGPHDRDETIGPNKPFKDLAEGLASNNIAVLRYDKRTFAHSARMAAVKDITVREEVVDDAAAAVRLAATLPGVDVKRIIVLGHSLGGYLLPKILAAEPKAAAGISLAGATRPLEDLVAEQISYLSSLNGTLPEEEKNRTSELRKSIAALKAMKPGDTGGPTIAGLPAHYLLDLRNYNPAIEAARLYRPMLFLQGGRDYQVTTLDLANWRAALGKRRSASFHLFPKFNHLFFAGEGPITPAEYSQPGHVDAEVITVIAKWLAPAAAPHGKK